MAVQILLREKTRPLPDSIFAGLPLTRHYGDESGMFWTTPLFEAIAYTDFSVSSNNKQ